LTGLDKLKLTEITIDSSLQVRESLNQEVINEYSEAIKEGAKFPAIKVFRVGSRYVLVDGFHRYFGHKKAGFADIEVEIIDGTMREATLYAIGSNPDHGLRLTNADKRKKIMMLLDDVEWAEMSNAEMARAAKVSAMTVSRIREQLGLKPAVVTATRNGKEFKVNTENIGKKNEPQEETYEDEIANEVAAIVEENEALTMRLAVAAMEATDEEKRLAQDQLMEKSATIKNLEIENRALKTSRDTFQNQCAELKTQVKYWQRRAEKAEKRIAELENQLEGLKNLAGM